MPYPHPEPLSLQQTTADPYLHRRCSNTVLSQSLWVPGSWSTQRLFEPSENLWQDWDLILNVNSPPPPNHLAGASPLPLDVEYLLTAGPVPTILLGFFWPWTWDVSTQPVQQSAGVTPDFGHEVSPHSHCSWPWTWGISSRPLQLLADTTCRSSWPY